MSNPFQELSEKLDLILQRVEHLETGEKHPQRIPFPDFCAERGISRPTGYSWAERGLIKLEKIQGRQFVLSNSITVAKKYQRQPEVV